MMVKSEFSYEEVNPYTCRLHVADYLTNADGIDLSNVGELYDLDKAGVQLYEYMSAHMACERDTEAEVE